MNPALSCSPVTDAKPTQIGFGRLGCAQNMMAKTPLMMAGARMQLGRLGMDPWQSFVTGVDSVVMTVTGQASVLDAQQNAVALANARAATIAAQAQSSADTYGPLFRALPWVAGAAVVILLGTEILKSRRP